MYPVFSFYVTILSRHSTVVFHDCVSTQTLVFSYQIEPLWNVQKSFENSYSKTDGRTNACCGRTNCNGHSLPITRYAVVTDDIVPRLTLMFLIWTSGNDVSNHHLEIFLLSRVTNTHAAFSLRSNRHCLISTWQNPADCENRKSRFPTRGPCTAS